MMVFWLKNTCLCSFLFFPGIVLAMGVIVVGHGPESNKMAPDKLIMIGTQSR